MTALPTAAEVAGILGRDVDAAFQLAYDAEVEDQAIRCETDPYASALAAALVRRVSRSLAVRALPLGIVQDELSGTTRVGGIDPEVRRLEEPYRKFTVA